MAKRGRPKGSKNNKPKDNKSQKIQIVKVKCRDEEFIFWTSICVILLTIGLFFLISYTIEVHSDCDRYFGCSDTVAYGVSVAWVPSILFAFSVLGAAFWIILVLFLIWKIVDEDAYKWKTKKVKIK